MFPHWNWDASNCAGLCHADEETGAPVSVDIWAYANADEVELYVNDKLVGQRQKMPAYEHVEWKQVPYAKGKIEVKAYTAGTEVADHTVTTAGAPAKLELTVEQGTSLVADKDDVSLIKVAVLDAQGVFVPTASNHIQFSVDGPGKIIGVGNGDPSCHEHDKAEERSAWNGLARAIVQATDEAGTIKFTATADGLPPATVSIQSAKPARPVPAL